MPAASPYSVLYVSVVDVIQDVRRSEEHIEGDEAFACSMMKLSSLISECIGGWRRRRPWQSSTCCTIRSLSWVVSSIAHRQEWLATEKRVVVIHRLHQILEPFMLRRQVQDVESRLPEKVRLPLEVPHHFAHSPSFLGNGT